jgi:hypothetical protein
MMKKSVLVAFAVLTLVDAFAWNGHYRHEFERGSAETYYWVKDQNWS